MVKRRESPNFNRKTKTKSVEASGYYEKVEISMIKVKNVELSREESRKRDISIRKPET